MIVTYKFKFSKENPTCESGIFVFLMILLIINIPVYDLKQLLLLEIFNSSDNSFHT